MNKLKLVNHSGNVCTPIILFLVNEKKIGNLRASSFLINFLWKIKILILIFYVHAVDWTTLFTVEVSSANLIRSFKIVIPEIYSLDKQSVSENPSIKRDLKNNVFYMEISATTFPGGDFFY